MTEGSRMVVVWRQLPDFHFPTGLKRLKFKSSPQALFRRFHLTLKFIKDRCSIEICSDRTFFILEVTYN